MVFGGGTTMNKGDLFNVYFNGKAVTICVVGFYNEEYSGEEMVLLAVVSQDNMVHLSKDDLGALFPRQRLVN